MSDSHSTNSEYDPFHWEEHVWCNVCLAPIPVSAITHKTDVPSVGDLTHWHSGHCITDEPGADNVDLIKDSCNATTGFHLCQRPKGHIGSHVCFMSPSACELGSW